LKFVEAPKNYNTFLKIGVIEQYTLKGKIVLNYIYISLNNNIQ